jgi:hypothetical protein
MASPVARAARLSHALVLAVVLLLLSASLAVAAPVGNNGTVKVHEGATENEPVVANDPHVCTFHLHFFFADPGQTGGWFIDQQPPTGTDESVLSGTYLTDANGEFVTVELGLPVGHYRVFWDGRNNENIKHKTFWVTCENPPGPIQQPT